MFWWGGGVQQNSISWIQIRIITYKVQMDFIQSKIRTVAGQLIKSRKYNYSQDGLHNYLEANPNIKCQHSYIKNKRGENLDTILIKNTYSDTCIVYAHGLGSNKIEVLPLVDCFKHSNYHICAFDFSGSGRSEGDYTTYGLREQDDINAILGYLDAKRQYDRYILWGRSMGGASIILSQSRNMNRKVQCIVLDSPFSSFQRAAIQIASKTTSIPEMMLNFIIQPIKQQMKKQYRNLNPFDLDITGAAAKIETRVMLIYSKEDSIVSFSHSKEIGRYCQKNAVEIEIEEDHNKPRKKQTYLQALKFINQTIQLSQSKARRRSMSKGRGISVSSKENSGNPNTCAKIRTSITSISIDKSKSQSQSMDRTQNLMSIGSFITNSSREITEKSNILCQSTKENNSQNSSLNSKQMYIKSVLMQNMQSRNMVRNSIKYGGNRYRNNIRLL